MAQEQQSRAFRAAFLVRPEEVSAASDTAVLLEVRRSPDPSIKNPAIVGAYLATLVEHFSGPASAGQGGNPLPDPDTLRLTLAQWRISEDTPVIVYAADIAETAVATRAWLVLRWAGIRSVRLLDGGLKAWQAQRGDNRQCYAPVINGQASLPVIKPINADEAARIAATGLLLDARNRDAYLGDDDPQSGHIPGAISAPVGELFQDGHLISPEAIAEWASRHGYGADRTTGVYCGRGVAASAVVFALATIGHEIPIYVGSWTAWSSDPSRPIEKGAPQHG